MPVKARAAGAYPLGTDKKEIFIAANEFASVGGGSWQPSATGDYIDFILPLPRDMLVGGQVGFTVVWSVATGSASDKVTWRVLYAKLTNDTTSAATAPATALDTTIAEDTAIATANAIQRTARGVIAAAKLITMVAGTDALKFRVNINAVTSLTLGTDVIDFYGLIVDYVPRQI